MHTRRVLFFSLKSGVVFPVQLGAADIDVLLVEGLDIEAVRLRTLQPEPVAGRGEVRIGKHLGVTRIRFAAEVVVLAQVLAHDEVLHGVFLTGRTGKQRDIGTRLVLVLGVRERHCARDEAGQHERQCTFLLVMVDHLMYSGSDYQLRALGEVELGCLTRLWPLSLQNYRQASAISRTRAPQPP